MVSRAFGVVFTFSPGVAALGLAHPAEIYDLLMRSAAATLRAVAANRCRRLREAS